MTDIEIIGDPRGILIMGEEEKTALKKLKEYAESNIVPLDTTLQRKPIGDNPMHVVVIPTDFRVVFSFHEQMKPLKLIRQMSISVSREERIPIPEAIQMVAVELGFRNNVLDTFAHLFEIHKSGKETDPGQELMVGNAMIWTEKFLQNRQAVNVMEKADIVIH